MNGFYKNMFRKIILVLFFVCISLFGLTVKSFPLNYLYCKNFIYKTPRSIVYEECSEEAHFQNDYFLLSFSGKELQKSQYYNEAGKLQTIQKFSYPGNLLQKEEIQLFGSENQERKTYQFFDWQTSNFVSSAKEEEIRMQNGRSYRLVYTRKTEWYKNNRLQSIQYSAKTKENPNEWSNILEVFYLQDTIQGYHVTKPFTYRSKTFKQEEFSRGNQRWITWYDLRNQPRISFDLGETHNRFSLYFYSSNSSSTSNDKKAKLLLRQEYEFSNLSFSEQVQNFWLDYYNKFQKREYRLSQKQDFWKKTFLPFFENSTLWKHRFWYFASESQKNTKTKETERIVDTTSAEVFPIFPFDLGNLQKIENYQNNQLLEVRYYDENSELEKTERYKVSGKKFEYDE